jgi:hypothetical protein
LKSILNNVFKLVISKKQNAVGKTKKTSILLFFEKNDEAAKTGFS